MNFSVDKELSLFISDIRNLKYWAGAHYTRIYFGNEICDRLLPTESQLKKVLHFCEKNKLHFTLVTPYCTNETLKKIKPLLKHLPQKTEIVFNDFGLLNLLQEQGLTPVFGRLLVSMAKDPRTPTENNSTLDFYYKASNIQISLLKFLSKKNVFRIELDNVKQGVDIPRSKLQFSLYIPYVYSAITAKCIFCNLEKQNAFFQSSAPCHQECRNKSLQVKTKDHQESIYIRGRAQYYVNNDKSLLSNPCIDRIVYMPVFPQN